jgi:hypothetical protein
VLNFKVDWIQILFISLGRGVTGPDTYKFHQGGASLVREQRALQEPIYNDPKISPLNKGKILAFGSKAENTTRGTFL